MAQLAGQLLISGPGLYDPNFRHTVVLLGGHDEEGAFGVILNRPSGFRVADVFPPLVELAGPEALVFEGGPVQPTQPILLGDLDDPSQLGVAVVGSIGFVTGEVSGTIRPLLRRARVFAGYAGWGAGQLEAELEQEAWILEPARPEDVFDDAPPSLWRRVLERKGPAYHHIAMMPFDPRTN